MSRIFSFALLVGGAALIAYGIGASNSIGSGLSRALTGAPTDRTIWLLVGGGVAALVGLAGALRGSGPP